MQSSGTELGLAEWCQIIDKLHKWGVRLVCIHGGEPTLRHDLPDIIAYASSKMAVSLTSNGDVFDRLHGHNLLTDLSDRGLRILNLSLHNVEEANRQIDSLSFAKSLGVIPVLTTVVTKTTIKDLPDIMVEAAKRGILYRYILYQSVGGSFSSKIDNLSPNEEELSIFISKVKQLRTKTGLVQATHTYMVRSAQAYPSNWHCNSRKDRWVVVDSKGYLMACGEHPTNFSVLEVQSLSDDRWIQDRTAKRESCLGCSYQCYMDEDSFGRVDFIIEDLARGIALLRNQNHSNHVFGS